MNEVLDIPPRRYQAPRDFEDNSEEILARCLAVLRESEPEFTGADLQDMLRFLMNKMFGEIGKRFESLGSDKQQQVADAVRKFIDDLPEAQREKLRNEIGTDKITDSYIRKAIVSGTLSTAFAAAVSLGGFGFYMGAVSLMAALAGLVGITLPFSFYMGVTSSIAVIANPIFFVPVVAGGGWWLYGRQNDKMRRRLAPLVVAQSVLAHLGGRANDLDHTDEALHFWQSAWIMVERARTELTESETALASTQEELRLTGNSIRALGDRRAQLTTDQDAIRVKVKTRCAMSSVLISRSEWGSHLHEVGLRLENLQNEAAACRTRPVKGVFDRISRSYDTWSKTGKADSAAGAAAAAAIDAGDGGASMYPTDVKDLVHRFALADDTRRAVDTELSTTQRKKTALEKQAAAEQQDVWNCRSECVRAEARYWGLSKLK